MIDVTPNKKEEIPAAAFTVSKNKQAVTKVPSSLANIENSYYFNSFIYWGLGSAFSIENKAQSHKH